MAQRQVEKKDNFISVQALEGETVTMKVGDEELIFIVPYDCFLNLYVKRESKPLFFK
jgi:hypothetical protein